VDTSDVQINQEASDNPYLRPVKMTRKLHGRKGHKVSNTADIERSSTAIGPNVNKIILSGGGITTTHNITNSSEAMDGEMITSYNNESGVISPTRDFESHNDTMETSYDSQIPEQNYNDSQNNDYTDEYEQSDNYTNDQNMTFENDANVDHSINNTTANASDVISPNATGNAFPYEESYEQH